MVSSFKEGDGVTTKKELELEIRNLKHKIEYLNRRIEILEESKEKPPGD